MTRLEDSLIIGLFLERKEQALEELDSKYGQAVKKTASNILSNRQDVEECVNDTYLGCWNSNSASESKSPRKLCMQDRPKSVGKSISRKQG